MTYQLKWLVPDHVLLVTLGTHIDWEAYERLDHDLAATVRRGLAPVDVIIDASEAQVFPTDMKALELRTTYMREPNLRWVMLAGRNKLLRLVMTVVSKKLDQLIYFQNTIDDAMNSMETAVDYS